jgi:hypothetical protein
VSRPIRLGVRPPSGVHDQIFSTVGHLQSSCCGAPSLMRGRVCNLLVQFTVTLHPKFHRTHDHILLSHLRVVSSLIIISYDSQGSNPPPHGLISHWSWSWSYYCGRQSVDQCVCVSGLPLGPLTRCYLALLSFNASSLMRKRVCSLQCNHSLFRAVTPNNYTLPSHLRLCSLFVASYDSQGLWWKYSNPPPHGALSLTLDLPCLWHLSTDHTENTVSLLLWECCVCSHQHEPLLQLMGHYLATAVLYLLILWSLRNTRSTWHNTTLTDLNLS